MRISPGRGVPYFGEVRFFSQISFAQIFRSICRRAVPEGKVLKGFSIRLTGGENRKVCAKFVKKLRRKKIFY